MILICTMGTAYYSISFTFSLRFRTLSRAVFVVFYPLVTKWSKARSLKAAYRELHIKMLCETLTLTRWTRRTSIHNIHTHGRRLVNFISEILLIFILKHQFTNWNVEQPKSYFCGGTCVWQVSFISTLRATVLAEVGGKIFHMLK
jgi:hypothetical protein